MKQGKSLNELDVAKLRRETAGCEDIIHFNAAGAALSPEPVYQALFGHLELERKIGGYEAERAAAHQLDAFCDEFAALLNCKTSEIAHVENATRAWDMAFNGLGLREGDRVITHSSEYASNYLAFLRIAKQRGVVIDVAPSDGSGQVDLDAMQGLITSRTRLIAINHAPTQGGLVNPAEEIGKIACAHGLIYILDACQSIGQMPLDVEKLGCHVLTGSGRKFLRGPRGTGFLYVSNDIVDKIEPPTIGMRGAEWTSSDGYEWAAGAKRFEGWESYVAGKIGLAMAVSYARSVGIDAIEARITTLAQTIRDRLKEEAGATIHDAGTRLCGTVTFTLPNETAAETVARLQQKNIYTHESQIIAARADFEARSLPSMVRASVHCFNTTEEIDQFMQAIRETKS